MSHEEAVPKGAASPGWTALIMRALLGRVGGPVFQQETKGWSYMGFWRALRGGCLPLMLALLLVTAAGCTLPVALITLSESMRMFERLMLFSVVLLVAVLLAGEGIRLIAGLLATALGATVIASEIEGERLSMLRVTLLTPRQIVAGKFAAVLHELRLPFRIAVLARLFVLAGGTILLIAALAYGIISTADVTQTVTPSLPVTPVDPTSPALPAFNPLSVMLVLADVVLGILLALIWLAYWLVEPLLSAALFTSMGVFGSSLARTRANGLLTALALRMGYGMLTYTLSQMVGVLVTTVIVPLMTVSSMPLAPAWLVALSTSPELMVLIYLLALFFSLLFNVAWSLGIARLLLGAAERRMEILPYGR